MLVIWFEVNIGNLIKNKELFDLGIIMSGIVGGVFSGLDLQLLQDIFEDIRRFHQINFLFFIQR